MANYNFESVSGSTITASNENDSIYFSSDIDSVSIDLGAGSDVLSIAGTANQITISGSGESNNITIATLSGANITNQINVANESSSKVSVQNLNSTRLFIYQTNGSGTNQVEIDSITGARNIFFMSVSGSASNEVVLENVESSNNFFAIDLGAGNHSFGSNSDQISIGNIADSNDFHMWLDGGNDSLIVGSVGNNVSIGAVAINSLTAEIGNVSDGGVLTFLGGNQFNSIKIENLGNSSYLNAELQDGNDIVEIGDIGSNSNITLQGNGGSDTFKLGNVQGNLEITSGIPKHINRVDVSRNPGITAESLESSAEFNGINVEISSIGTDSSVNISGGSDSDRISINGIDSANVSMNLGDGNDSIFIDTVSSTANISINSGSGDDYIDIASGANLLITYESGNDTINNFDSNTTLVANGSLIATNSGYEVSVGSNIITIITDSSLTSDSNGNILAIDLKIDSVDGGNTLFSISSDLNEDITLTGSSSNSNIFYAESNSVSSKSDQSTITITNIDFNSGDAILVDAGVKNLTADFFGNGKFYNYANAADASTSGVYAGTVFDASDLVSTSGITFSMIHMADGSVTLNDDNEIDEDSIYSVVWTNSGSTAIINFSDSQNDEILLFTNANGTTRDFVSLGGDFNDTIYAGANDTISAGDGNDIISIESGAAGKNAVANGGEGNDTIYAGRGTIIVYKPNFSGDDIVYNFTAGTSSNSNVIDMLGLVNGTVSINNSGELEFSNDNGTTTFVMGSGTFTNQTDIKFVLTGTKGVIRVADSTHTVYYDKDVTAYQGGENGTVIVDSSSSVNLNLAGSDVSYYNIANIDASSATGRINISGDSNDNVLYGGQKSSTLWGGGGNDTLIGGTGRDVFVFNSSDGNVTIQNGDSNDVVDLSSYTIDEISNYEFTDSGLIISVGESSLNIVGTSMTTFSLASGKYTADFTNHTFNS